MTYYLPSDKRYTVSREWTGKEKPQFVVRFCDEWLGSRGTYGAAVMLAAGESAARRGALVVEAVE